MKIGIFDSGIGGMSVLHEAYHLLPPDLEYIFYADTEHVPYGLKTPQQIKGYVTEITQFLIEKGVDAIVVACNTATSVAIEEIREKFTLPILGMEPAVKPAVEGTENRRVMVIATPVTIRESKLQHLLQRVDEDHRVDLLPMPQLVTFAEREEFEGPQVEDYLRSQFSEYDLSRYCALVLGCTHFNYFKPSYRKYFGDGVMLIDGNAGTIHHLAQVMHIETTQESGREILFADTRQMLETGHTQYYMSGKEVSEEKMLEHLMRLHNRLEAVRGI